MDRETKSVLIPAWTILGFILLLLLVQQLSCAVTPVNVSTAVTTVEVAAEIYKKVKDLHEAGVPLSELTEMRQALIETHAVVDHHHGEHFGDKGRK